MGRMLILIGPGIFFIVEVDKIPETGDILNLGNDIILRKGQYKMTNAGTKKWAGQMYNYFTYEYVGEIPKKESPLSMAQVGA